jgi:hypothetical protein
MMAQALGGSVMDWVSIISAGIAGGAGGALGAILGSLFQNNSIRTALVVALAVICGNLGKPLVEPHVETYLGASLRGGQFDSLYESQIKAEITKIPALERIFKDDPTVEQRFKDKARAAYEKGGAKELLESASGIGAEIIGEALGRYLPRARAQDLILFAKTMTEVLDVMNAKDPEACILHQFGASYGKPLPTSRLDAVIGKEGQEKQLAALNALVTNAGPTIVAFDKPKADAAIPALAQRHAPLLTGNSAEVAGGKRPPANVEEAKVACSFALALFKDVSTMDPATAELVLRAMFATG